MTAVAPRGGFARLTPARASAREQVAVRVDRVSKTFPARRGIRAILRGGPKPAPVRALSDVSLEVRPGEFFGLLGPNGAGKTTLFKLLATLVTPTTGSVTIAGLDAVREAAAVRRALVPVIADERSLHWRLSARENLRLFAALYGIHGAEQRRRIDEVLALVGLGHAASRQAGSFSSGMRQRLLLGRALLPRPRVLLLDEPTRSLDPISARDFRQFLRREVAGPAGCTVLLATHSTDEAFELCDRVAILDRGRLLAVGATASLAAEFGEELYAVWTDAPEHAVWRMLERRGLVRIRRAEPAEMADWFRLSVELPGGMDRAAQVLDLVTSAGVAVGRFERVAVTLADLIERVVAARGAPDEGHA